MAIIHTGKELSTAHIDCGGSLGVKLTVTARPDITENPTDIVLVLDRSGSMAGMPLTRLKAATRLFIDLIDEATDGGEDGQLGHGTRMGVVSFSDFATRDTQLTTSTAALKDAVNALSANGSTNHADAFTKALQLFDDTSSNARVLVMFTDGMTTAGGDPNPIAAAARASGVTIYCIGLVGSDGLDEQLLLDWASDPDDEHVAITPDADELEELFAQLARTIASPGAVNVVLRDVLNGCFRITAIATPNFGTAEQLDASTLEWRIDELGVTHTETAVLEFTVRHTGGCDGDVEVNEDILFEDDAGQTVVFPSPTVHVECGGDVWPEPCPQPIALEFDGCSDSVELDAGSLSLGVGGSILQLDVTLNNVCPGRRVALAVVLSEVVDGCEEPRGMKVLTVPALSGGSCRSVTVRCIRFVVPASDGCVCCARRSFRARLLANYLDSGFDCCACMA